MSLKRKTETAVRATFHVQRIAEELRKALDGTETEGQPLTSLLILCNGYFMTSAGEGDLYRNFIQRNDIRGSNYSGKNVRAREVNDPHYMNSRLRIMPFNHGFNHCTTNVEEREYYMVKFRIFNFYSNVFLHFISKVIV